MKRVGILLILAMLLLPGCAAGRVEKETVSTTAPEMEEKLESAEASENKQVKVADTVFQADFFDLLQYLINRKVFR